MVAASVRRELDRPATNVVRHAGLRAGHPIHATPEWRDDALERRRPMMEAWGRFWVPPRAARSSRLRPHNHPAPAPLRPAECIRECRTPSPAGLLRTPQTPDVTLRKCFQ